MSAYPHEKKDVEVKARMKPSLKAAAEKNLAHYGLSTSQAINIFFQKIVEERGLPFDLKIPNEETQEAFAQTEEMIQKGNFKSYKDTKKMFNDILSQSGEKEDKKRKK